MDRTQFPEERLVLEGPGGQRLFPHLGSDFEVLATSTEGYNCIAYSLGRLSVWINPQTGPEEDPFASMDILYQGLGFIRAGALEVSLEPGKRKVVLYATRTSDGGIERITHAAVQEADGNWVSKLGQGPLIRHETPAAVSGPLFGEPVAVYVGEVLRWS
jgi:type VI secretion system secreted protein VgrG